MKMEQRQCSETLVYKIKLPGNYPEESTQHSEHGESLKSSHISFTTPHSHKVCLDTYHSDIPICQVLRTRYCVLGT